MLSRIIDIIVSSFPVCLFSLWFLASVLVYVPNLTKIIRSHDRLGLIPRWNFFAPNPARHDFHLLFRDQLPDGSMTEWREVASIAERRYWNFIWNPTKRKNKSLFDAINELLMHAKFSMPALKASIPYLTLLNYVSGLSRFGPVRFTQFLVMRSAGNQLRQKSEILFLSELHSL